VSIEFEYYLERIGVIEQILEFPSDAHLENMEHQYCLSGLLSPNTIFLIRETEEGWWRESVDLKGDAKKQTERLKNDPTVACAWINTPRFSEKGGWHDPS